MEDFKSAMMENAQLKQKCIENEAEIFRLRKEIEATNVKFNFFANEVREKQKFGKKTYWNYVKESRSKMSNDSK